MLSKLALFGVERQPVAGVDVEREQLAHGALVLGAVQPLEGAAAGIGVGRRAFVDPRLERVGERGEQAGLGRFAPGGGIMPALQLADHLLGDVRVLVRPHGVEGGERQPAGLARARCGRSRNTG